jgi:threonine aldolase
MAVVPSPHSALRGSQFASDNTASVCPEVWSAMQAANTGAAPSYGDDAWTERARAQLRALFERPDAQVYFVLNGTAANSLALAACCRSYEAIVCHEHAHIDSDECGAPQFFSGGASLLPVRGAHGKLAPQDITQTIIKRRDIHAPRPAALSISQSTELGAVYTLAQIRSLADLARGHGLRLHMDGARFANALAALGNVSAADMSWRAGVDVLSLGGTKNGAQMAEALLFFDAALAARFDYQRKQGGQLASKMRYLSSQWLGLLTDGAWLRYAAHANAMAQRLGRALSDVSGLSITQPIEANAVFVRLDAARAEALRAVGWQFHAFDAAGGYRFMCAWNTREEDIALLVADLRAA